MPTILMTQNKRVLTNTRWCHHFLPQEASERKRRGLGQVDQIKGLGTSPTCPLFLPPFRYNLKECACHSVPTVTCIIWLGWGVLKSADKALPWCPSKLWGLLVPTHSSSEPPGSLRSVGSLPSWTHSDILAGLTCYSRTLERTPVPKGAWEALQSRWELPPVLLPQFLDSNRLL